jgi:predicted amidophosphoribosyltransferase
MSAGFGVATARVPKRPRANLCGDCGAEVDQGELLCVDCRNETTPRGDDAEMSS